MSCNRQGTTNPHPQSVEMKCIASSAVNECRTIAGQAVAFFARTPSCCFYSACAGLSVAKCHEINSGELVRGPLSQ